MADKMLIDASHEEETRVVVVRGNRIEEFDFESQHKKQLRGNIYLAKVTRVEPSLQAAFVDYGGNRHGFLAFSEIHPDYYQIPLADRQALLAAEAEAEAERARSENDDDDGEEDEVAAREEPESAEKEEAPKGRNRRGRRKKTAKAEESVASEEQAEIDEAVKDLEGANDPDEDENEDRGPGEMAAVVETESVSEPVSSVVDDEERDPGEVDEEAAKHVEGKIATPLPGRDAEDGDDEAEDDKQKSGGRRRRSRNRRDDHEDGEDENGGKVESVGAEDALEEVPDRSVRKPRKQYRIQEVIKRRQILLVQVVKEERGNKGAALTTYLSLAGRYSVLMPNTARGGGISRKITNVPDRKRLKEIARGLDVPQGMGVILRTAGANRTKAEIKRDFEYLMRLWENVRSLTLASTAPCLVYEEGSLIKRSIRDLYNKDIGEVVVSGEEGYREAKDFMKMLMPSHAKVVQPYREVHPIFSRSGIEAQLDRMLQPQVTLKSGGYIIINQTEALVAIDVNSGRSTKEHSIEDTALQTNLEAADEVARQLRLRDLAGLIVVDFIDMEEKRNNRSVEKRLKDALKNDRARIQVGRISHFGLLEMSRQRIRASVLESTTQVCEHCGGTGHVRSQSSVALHVIRSIEEFLLKSTTHDITVRTMPETALYVLNQKRETIVEMERRFGVSITVEADATIGSAHLAIDRGAPVEVPVSIADLVQQETAYPEEDDDAVPTWDDEAEEEGDQPSSAAVSRGEEGDDQRRRKRRRRRRGGRGRQDGEDQAEALHGDAEAETDESDADEVEHASGDEGEEERPRKRRRRGKRGGRRNRGGDEAPHAAAAETDEPADADSPEFQERDETAEAEMPAEAPAEQSEPEPVAAVTEPAEAAATAESVSAEPAPAAEEEEEKPKKRRASRAKKAETTTDTAEEPKPKRTRRSKKAAAADEPAQPDQPATEAEQPAETVEEAAAPAEEEPAPATLPDRSAPAEKVAPVVTSNGRNGDEPEASEQKPKKVGWWQRRGFF